MGMEVPPEGGLTLRRLAVWVQEPLERMRLLACLVRRVGPGRVGLSFCHSSK